MANFANVNHIDPLIELFCKSRKPVGHKPEPQWKKNLKHQNPDVDLPDAA
ncbi:hypothetical protein MWU63_13080 [Pseudohalocynthiibacter sp. F2068]|nr:hypothetical protein [Pseudohalocynthiibacter sp. F2068]